MFGKAYTMTMNRVHDTVRVHEGTETLMLSVDGDSLKMVAGMSNIQKELKSISAETTEEETLKIATDFATVIFGKDGAEKLVAFYRNDPGCVINLCSRYFTARLMKLIEKTQKKIKR